MKKILSLALILASISLYAQNVNTTYNSKSGKLSYKFELGGTNMDYTLLFDQYGKRQAIINKTTIDGLFEETKTIFTNDNLYIINYSEEQVIKMPLNAGENPMGEEANGEIDLGQIVSDVSEMEHLKKGSETLLGKTCDVYIFTENEGGRGKYWIWNNYLMKAEFMDESGQHSYMEATEIKLDITLPSDSFDIPDNFTVTDMGAMMNQMKQMQQMYGVPENE